MSLKRQMKEKNKLQKEYDRYYKSEPSGKAMTYYNWKKAMHPETMEQPKKESTSTLKRVKKHSQGQRASLEGALTKEEIARLNRKS